MQGLQRAIEVLLKPWRKAAESSGKPVLSLPEVNTLFGNIEEIHRLATALLPKLQEVISKWNISTRVADLVAQGTGSEQFINAYCTYAKEYDNALKVLNSSRMYARICLTCTLLYRC